jgi:hypothetical protein
VCSRDICFASCARNSMMDFPVENLARNEDLQHFLTASD